MQAATDGSTVRRVTANEMSLDVAPNIFLNVAPPVRPFYTFPEWNRVHYLLQFTPAVGVATVLGVSAGQTSFLADVTGPGAPFGFIDMPGDEAVCDGQIRISGWALDDREVTRIVARRDREPADSPGPASVEIGEGTWTRDTRPDIASVYKGFPHTERAEWNVYLSCAVLDALPGRQARVRISAVDAAGHETELGARTIHASRPDGIAR
jgi:hypothetical protein